MAPMHVNHAREVPEYEIDAHELDFTNSVDITKVISPSYDMILFICHFGLVFACF